jgi:hypothetical protein|tara:strand:- start:186 stop:374 length:189 start_codon:yes stop_codon:yes gene_type:complete
MPKPIFTSSDATITNHKIDKLVREFKAFTERLERIQEEVILLRQANHAMAKTIKESRYAPTE